MNNDVTPKGKMSKPADNGYTPATEGDALTERGLVTPFKE